VNYVDALNKRGISTFSGAGAEDVFINCPFHNDQKPSCEVNIHNGLFHCFGCGESGSFAKLLAEIENIPLDEAKRRIMDGESIDSVHEDLKKKLLDMDDEKELPKFFDLDSFNKVFAPVAGTAGMNYLKKRNISEKTAERYNLRWGDHGKWENRIIIPICTDKGKLLTWAGRTIIKDLQPKTRKVGGRSSLFTLFGLYQILDEAKIRKVPYLIVCEGEFDAMYLMQNGYYAVATMGTAKLTGEQMALLKRHCASVVWSYDGDNAGRRAQKEGFMMTKKIMRSFTISLPEGKDPNDLTPDEIRKIYKGVDK
jgi:DNA primase